MCTVIFIARQHGYALGMNRDERRVRVGALPPARHRLGNREVLLPSEPGGGTWIGVNDRGITLALINWYSVPPQPGAGALSRGQVIVAALAADSIDAVHAVLAELPLNRFNPFRLIGVFREARAVVEWQWNRRRLTRLDHPWRSSHWISSGYDEPGAQRERGRTCREALRQRSAGSLRWLRRLHRSHRPARGPYSICMHRKEAVTVSYTEVRVTDGTASMGYFPGSPCRLASEGAADCVHGSLRLR